MPRTPEFMDSANLYATRVYDGKAVDLTPATDGDGTVSRVITNRETNEVLTSDLVDVGEYRVVYRVSEGKKNYGRVVELLIAASYNREKGEFEDWGREVSVALS